MCVHVCILLASDKKAIEISVETVSERQRDFGAFRRPSLYLDLHATLDWPVRAGRAWGRTSSFFKRAGKSSPKLGASLGASLNRGHGFAAFCQFPLCEARAFI